MNANWSQFAANFRTCCTKLVPLDESGGAANYEAVSAIKDTRVRADGVNPNSAA